MSPMGRSPGICHSKPGVKTFRNIDKPPAPRPTKPPATTLTCQDEWNTIGRGHFAIGFHSQPHIKNSDLIVKPRNVNYTTRMHTLPCDSTKVHKRLERWQSLGTWLSGVASYRQSLSKHNSSPPRRLEENRFQVRCVKRLPPIGKFWTGAKKCAFHWITI